MSPDRSIGLDSLDFASSSRRTPGNQAMEGQDLISIVVPVFNEADNLRPLYQAVIQQLDAEGLAAELLFVNDGSHDDSMAVLRQLSAEDRRVRVISLSRNFGHQCALSAGMEFARGDAVIVMDADLQHPPEMIPQMVALWRTGVEIVYTIREYDKEVGRMKRWTSAAFYRLINAISDVPIMPGAADFRLMDRSVVECLVAMPERSRFLRGMVSWLGFRQQGLRYRANPRLSGKSKYSLRKMFNLAMEGVTSLSSMPLRVSGFLGLVAALAGLPYAIWAVYARCFTQITVPGWTSLLVAVMFLGGVQLMSIGVIGEYVGRIYTEVKGRPLYLTRELIGFDQSDSLPACPPEGAIVRFPRPDSSASGFRRAQVPHR